MHPHAPSCAPSASVDPTEAKKPRSRFGWPRMGTLIRVTVVLGAFSGVVGFAFWLKEETPHPLPAIANRKSPLFEARSLKPLLETAKPATMQAYALQRGSWPETAEAQPLPPPSATTSLAASRPVWLMADAAKTADLLRQNLRDRGARQMGSRVRLAMLNIGELLALDEGSWNASLATPAGTENETSALLLTFYLHYLDRLGDAAGVKAMSQAMAKGASLNRAISEFVLGGRSVAEFQQEMSTLYAAVGVELQFTRRGGAVFRP